ncbi:MAG: hypothetical protein SFV17_21025 [Candidatus Obscuribacter sp.]|nr:hypothetical protein [Candidatus Obscuribacter sp.]
MSAENCHICGQTRNVSVAGHCQGHGEGAGGPASSAGSAPMVGMSLKDQLDAIPTPSSVANSAPGSLAAGVSSRVTGQNLGAVGAPFPDGGPRSSTSRAPQLSQNGEPALGPGTGAAPVPAPMQQTGDVPQWMRNFQDHQSSIMPTAVAPAAQSHSSYGGGAPSVTPNYSPTSSSFDPPAQGSGYAVMIGSVIFICVIMFVYMMMNKPQSASLTTPASSNGSSVSESGAGVSTQPSSTNTSPFGPGQVSGQMPGSPTSEGLSPNPVPAAVAPSPNPVPSTAGDSPNPVPAAVSPNPVPATAGDSPNPVPTQVPATNP